MHIVGLLAGLIAVITLTAPADAEQRTIGASTAATLTVLSPPVQAARGDAGRLASAVSGADGPWSHMATYRYLVAGRVQGVGYRYFALQEAQALGLGGFARNLDDGRVEVVAEGPADALSAFEARLRQGPAFAKVTGVERASSPERGEPGFHIR